MLIVDGPYHGGFAQTRLEAVTALRDACPEAAFGLCLTIPPNSDEFCMDGKPWDRYSWKRAHHQFIKDMIAKFKGRGDESIHLIPTELTIDTDGGFPDFNQCHPNRHGYYQIADTVYCWLKTMLNKTTATSETNE